MNVKEGIDGSYTEKDLREMRNLSQEDVLHKDIRIISPITPAELTEWLNSKINGAGRTNSKMKDAGEAFYNAAVGAGIDPIYLAAHAAHETLWGTSRICRDKNNFFGIGAVDRAPYEKAYTYDSVAEGIKAGAEWIAENYPYGEYDQYSLYKMRWNSGVHQYASDGHGPTNPVTGAYDDPASWDEKIADTMIASGLPIAGVGRVLSDQEIAQRQNENDELLQRAIITSDGEYQYGGEFDYAGSNTEMAVEQANPNSYFEEEDTSNYDIPDLEADERKPVAIPNNYYDDDFSELPHRMQVDTGYHLRIGDTRFTIPPTQINITESSNIESLNVARRQQSIKMHTGNSIKQISMTLYFSSTEQVNGYPMSGPDGQTYYMDGLRSLMAQFKLMPFLPVENEFLNEVHDIWSIALQNVSVSTEPLFPGMLKADLTLLEFNVEALLGKPNFTYDLHFMWPLFRWHYQRLLRDDKFTFQKLWKFGKDTLPPVFYHMNADTLANYEVVKNNKSSQGKADMTDEHDPIISTIHDDEDREEWFYQFVSAMKNFNAEEELVIDDEVIGEFWTQFEVPYDLTLIQAQASTGITLSPLTPKITGKPVFQYMGSQDTRFNLIFQTHSREAATQIRTLRDLVEQMAREYRNQFFGSPMVVFDKFINLFGVRHVFMESVTVDTVPNQPDTYNIGISMISYDPEQYEKETLDYLGNEYIDKDEEDLQGYTTGVWNNFIVSEVAAENMLNEMQLYPDLSLPTYVEANEIIGKINKWRGNRGLDPMPISELQAPAGGTYVDPDFYLSYPSITSLAKYFNEVMLETTDVEPVDIDKIFGEQIQAELDLIHANKKDYEEIKVTSAKDLQKTLEKYDAYIRNKENYEKSFYLDAYYMDSSEHVADDIEFSDGAKTTINSYQKAFPAYQAMRYYGEEQIARMLHDRIKYNRRGTLMRAFPTYIFVIIDEGSWINARKFWDNYYTYHAVSNISVVRDREQPMDVAYMEVGNVYNSLSQQQRSSIYMDENMPFWEMVWGNFVTHINEKELEERNQVFKRAKLMAGARIHLRVGYGSTASEIPPLFNGVIAEIQHGDTVKLVAQSDGHELVSYLDSRQNQTNTLFEEGWEPHSIFRHYLIERRNNVAMATGHDILPDDFRSKYGIEHFGYIWQKNEPHWLEFFNPFNANEWFDTEGWNTESYDMLKNIYSTTGRAFSEQNMSRSGVVQQYIEDNIDELPTVKEYYGKTINVNDLGIPGSSAFMDNIHKYENESGSPVNDMYVVFDFIAAYDLGNREKMEEAIYIAIANNMGVFAPDAVDAEKELTSFHETLVHQQSMNDEVTDAEINRIMDTIREMHSESKGALDQANKVWKQMKGNSYTGEQNVRMYVTNKTPWDVFKALEQITPGYIAYPHIHNFHYTMFFGKPMWDVKAGYALPWRESDHSSSQPMSHHTVSTIMPDPLTFSDRKGSTSHAKVLRVIDGDTVEVEVLNGEHEGENRDVRLLLVDTPEITSNDPYAEEAKAYTESKLLNRTVYLEFGNEETDEYDRFLVYIWHNDRMFNEELIRSGLARVAYVNRWDQYFGHFSEVESATKTSGIGIWSLEDYVQTDVANAGYDASASPDIYGNKITDYKELSKPFSQLHVFNGYEDIIGNNIRASGENLITAAVAVYQQDGWTGGPEKLDTLWADFEIRSSFQKTKVIDTTIVNDTPWVPAVVEDMHEGIKNGIFKTETKTQRHAYRFVTQSIANSFRNMYKGNLLVVGDPAVKPYDLMFMDDRYNRMNGTASVGRVVHEFSIQTGFTTSVKPDMAVAVHPEPWNNEGKTGWESGVPEELLVVASTLQYGSLTALAIGKSMQFVKEMGTKNITNNVVKIGKKSLNSAKVWNKIGGAYNKVKGLKKASFFGSLGRGVAGVSRGIRWLAKPITPWGIVITGVFFLSDAVVNWVRDIFYPKGKNVIKIMPLFKDGQPYIAGVNGHKNLIPGWLDDGNGRPVQTDLKEYKDEIKAIREQEQLAKSKVPNIQNYKTMITALEQQEGIIGFVGSILDFTADSIVNAVDFVTGKDSNIYYPVTEQDETAETIENDRISSPYADQRSGYQHTGDDFTRGYINKQYKNKELITISQCIVVATGWDSDGFGNYIIMRNGINQDPEDSTIFSLYAHCDEIFVETGDKLEAGQIVARMGNTGNVYPRPSASSPDAGTHLHLEMYVARSQYENNMPSMKASKNNDWINYVLTRNPNENPNAPHTVRKHVKNLHPLGQLKKYKAKALGYMNAL